MSSFFARFAPALGVVFLTASAAAAQSGQPAPAPTFSKDVAPILFKHCTNCQRPGEIGPML